MPLDAVALIVVAEAAFALPDDDEVPLFPDRNCGGCLDVGGVAVDPELLAEGRAVSGEALALDPEVGAVAVLLAVAVPDDDEVSG